MIFIEAHTKHSPFLVSVPTCDYDYIINDAVAAKYSVHARNMYYETIYHLI